jgi:hypothetical protein
MLRSKGNSYKWIASKLGISSSTVSLWCADIKLSKELLELLEKRAHDPMYGQRWSYIQKIKRDKETRINESINTGMRLVGDLSIREKLLVGIALYWAEGFKKDEMVGFSNSDPLMIQFMLRWLVNSLKVDASRIRLRVVINVSHVYRTDRIVDYWSKLTKIPLTQFYKPTLQKHIQKKIYPNEDSYYGVLRIRVLKSTNLLREIMGMIKAL